MTTIIKRISLVCVAVLIINAFFYILLKRKNNDTVGQQTSDLLWEYLVNDVARNTTIGTTIKVSLATATTDLATEFEEHNGTDNNKVMYKIPSSQSHSVIHHLSNVVIVTIRGTIHHIYSAYFDSRKLPNRPAIIMLGYVKSRSTDALYCKFIYNDNSTKCMGKVVEKPLIAPNVRPEMYICKMSNTDKIPTHVMLSSSMGKGCAGSQWSSPIPVWNRESRKPDGIGVCVQNCLYYKEGGPYGSHEDIIGMVVEFLSMVKVLGASTVTIYNRDINIERVEKIYQLYPAGFVEIVQWKNLTGILHSHGLRVLINDCLYRNMKRVRYLAFMDLDEMFLPVSTVRWMDMLDILEKKGKYASYTFSNNFIEEVPANASIISSSNDTCPYMKNMPKYFVRLNRLPWPGFKQHTKMKMIVKPELISVLCNHDICQPTVSGYSRTYRVPGNVGMMAHYRIPVPRWYVYGKGVEDRTALKYRGEVMEEMKRVCSEL